MKMFQSRRDMVCFFQSTSDFHVKDSLDVEDIEVASSQV